MFIKIILYGFRSCGQQASNVRLEATDATENRLGKEGDDDEQNNDKNNKMIYRRRNGIITRHKSICSLRKRLANPITFTMCASASVCVCASRSLSHSVHILRKVVDASSHFVSPSNFRLSVFLSFSKHRKKNFFLSKTFLRLFHSNVFISFLFVVAFFMSFNNALCCCLFAINSSGNCCTILRVTRLFLHSLWHQREMSKRNREIAKTFFSERKKRKSTNAQTKFEMKWNQKKERRKSQTEVSLSCYLF